MGCYRLNVCVTAKFMYWNPNTQYDIVLQVEPLGSDEVMSVELSSTGLCLPKESSESFFVPSAI